MFKKPTYSILIENFLIGTTEFEFADVPMGIVYGKLLFTDLKSPYSFLNNYCLVNNIPLNINDEKLKIIDTQVIPKLKVFDSKNIELIGWGGSITGVENEQDLDFEITFAGINHETLQNTFPEHYSAYYE